MSKKQFCEVHPKTALVVVTYCPKCRGKHGGATTAARLSAAERKRRASKAAQARWKSAKGEKP
jgi:hypothetical protein